MQRGFGDPKEEDSVAMRSGPNPKGGNDKRPRSERLARTPRVRGQLRSVDPRGGDKIAKVSSGRNGVPVGD